MADRIYLTGYMGTGKTSVSLELGRILGFVTADMDSIIEKNMAMTIKSIFSEKGEPFFRELETETLKRLSAETGIIISCGGGVVLKEENIAIMRESGFVALLEASPSTIYRRTKGNGSRPLLKGKGVDAIAAMMETRRGQYEKAAHFKISTDHRPVPEIAREIMKAWEMQKKKGG